jgi:hypothetical protein
MAKLFEKVVLEDGEEFYPIGYISRAGTLSRGVGKAFDLSDGAMRELAEEYGNRLQGSASADDCWYYSALGLGLITEDEEEAEE